MLHAVLTSADHANAEASPARCAPELADTLCPEAPRLRRLVHRLLGWRTKAADLDDLVQDVLLKAWRRRDTFRGDAALATWLHRIAITTVHNHVRAETGWRRVLALLGRQGARAAAAADGGDTLDATQRAMQRLAHPDREVLVLRYLEQRDIADVAALLGCTRAAVDARLTRARSRLRSALGLQERP